MVRRGDLAQARESEACRWDGLRLEEAAKLGGLNGRHSTRSDIFGSGISIGSLRSLLSRSAIRLELLVLSASVIIKPITASSQQLALSLNAHASSFSTGESDKGTGFDIFQH